MALEALLLSFGIGVGVGRQLELVRSAFPITPNGTANRLALKL